MYLLNTFVVSPDDDKVFDAAKDPTYTSSSMQFWKYFADVKNISNMYPYGKSYGTNAIYNATDDYRYGFNGQFPFLSVAKEGWQL